MSTSDNMTDQNQEQEKTYYCIEVSIPTHILNEYMDRCEFHLFIHLLAWEKQKYRKFYLSRVAKIVKTTRPKIQRMLFNLQERNLIKIKTLNNKYFEIF